MLEPIPFAGMVEIDNPVECCNHNCNQGRDCPLRKKELTDEEIMSEWEESKNEVEFARAILRKASEK